VIVPINDPTNYTAFNVASGKYKAEGMPPGHASRWPVREVGYDTVRGAAFFQLGYSHCEEHPVQKSTITSSYFSKHLT